MKLSMRMIGLAIFLLFTVVLLCGCNVNWITETQALIPVLGGAAGSFVGLLAAFGKVNVSQDLMAKIQKWQSELSKDLSDLKDLIIQYETADPGADKDSYLQEIESLTQTIVSDFKTILPDLHITNPASQAKVTAIANAILIQMQSIAAIVPAVRGSAKLQQVANAGNLPLNAHQFVTHFNQVMAHGTGDTSTDDAVLGVGPLPVPQVKV